MNTDTIYQRALGSLEMPGYEESWYNATGSGAINNPVQLYQSMLNEQRNYNLLQMQREDTAYQRMVADMKKAGLNPWTGIASGGSSSSPMTAPQKSSLEGLLSILSYNVDRAYKGNSSMISGIQTGLKLALPFLALLGA